MVIKMKDIMIYFLVGLALLSLLALGIEVLWNCIVVELFNLPIINKIQALGLWLLCNLLFGGVNIGTDR